MQTILQCVGGLGSGGTENWLLNCLEQPSLSRHRFVFVVHRAGQYALTDKAQKAGGEIAVCAGLPNPVRYMWNLARIIHETRPDAVHIHLDVFSVCPLLVAFICRVPIRVVHSHSDTRRNDGVLGGIRRRFSSALLRLLATDLIACSKLAAKALFRNIKNVTVLHCGVPLEPMRIIGGGPSIRQMLRISADDFVVATIGRCTVEKNQRFLLQVFVDHLSAKRNVRLVIVGDGELRETLQEYAAQCGVAEQCRFIPYHPHPQEFLREVADVFAFPSLFEGLGLALIDAQAADIPSVISEFIPDEAIVCPDLCHRVSVSSGSQPWADMILRLISDKRSGRYSAVGYDAVYKSDFNIATSARKLALGYAAPRAW